jgi:uncharacterized membrane protein
MSVMSTNPAAKPGATAARSARLWEIDSVRGVAVLAMIFFHFMWDLQFFGLTDIDVFSPAWQTFARAIGTTFMFVMGVSLTLDAVRYKGNSREIWRRNLKRGLMIFGAGMLVTLVTFFIVGNEFVRFGILHLAGASIILATPFVNRRARGPLIAGMVLIAAGFLFGRLSAPYPWLIPLGIRQAGVDMVDYYPLVPWFGVALLGVAFGTFAYPNKQRRFDVPDWGGSLPTRFLQFIGRHSLAIYLLHQPFLIALIFVATQVPALLR